MTARPVEVPTPLEEFPETTPVPETEEARHGWRIEHPGQLDWAMRKLAEKRRERRLVATRARAEVDRIQAWAAQEDARVGQHASWFEAVIAEYALTARAGDERRKSISTPYGVVKTRVQQAPWDIDDTALLPWLKKHHPDLVKIVESVRVGEVKKVLGNVVDGALLEGGLLYDSATGEQVPGVKVGESSLTATVDVDLGLHADDEDVR